MDGNKKKHQKIQLQIEKFHFKEKLKTLQPLRLFDSRRRQKRTFLQFDLLTLK